MEIKPKEERRPELAPRLIERARLQDEARQEEQMVPKEEGPRLER